MQTGYVKALHLDKGFGFIAEPDQPDVFFHRSDLAEDLPFDETLEEQRVRFHLIGTDKGLKAVDVQAAD